MGFRRSSNCKLHETASSKVWSNRAAFIAQHTCPEHSCAVLRSQTWMVLAWVWLRHTIEQCTPCAERARRSQTRVRFWVWLHHTLKQSMPYMRELWRLHWPNPILIYRWRKLSVWYVRIIYIHALYLCTMQSLLKMGCYITPLHGALTPSTLLKLPFKTSIITGMV